MKKTDYREKTKEENEFNKKFGAELNILIKKDKKIYKQDLYKNIGLSNPGTLSQYLNGNKGLSVYRFSKIMKTINLSDPEIISLFRYTDVNRASEPVNLSPRLVEKPLPFPDAESRESCEILTEAVKYKDGEPLINKTYEHILLLLKDLKKDILSAKKVKRGKKNTA